MSTEEPEHYQNSRKRIRPTRPSNEYAKDRGISDPDGDFLRELLLWQEFFRNDENALAFFEKLERTTPGRDARE
jgi:hypothetical protein